MDEILLTFDKKSPQERNNKIKITIANNTGVELLYKFLVGLDGVWKVLKDFGEANYCTWTPKKDGKYLILVQAKIKGSQKPFDYKTMEDFFIGTVEEQSLINEVYIDKKDLILGEKITVQVETARIPAMYRYWISGKDGWQLIKDYTIENKLVFTAREEGKHEILVECKVPESNSNFDDFKTVSFTVKGVQKLEIIDFKCLTKDLLIGEELIFQVEAKYDDSRTILYKFVKIGPDGKACCLQDYSSRTMVNFTEKERGTFKLLCLARDMYSAKEYDDRALMVYEIQPYYPVNIKTFTTDLSSPQMEGNTVLIKSVVEGGKNLLYRFKIDGSYGEDSGYTRSNSYIWECKHADQYKITVWVKDDSFEGEYEDKRIMEFVVEKKSQKPVKITDVVVDRDSNYIINDPINIKVIAEGGTDLKYSFIVYKDKKEKEKVPYGNSNWVNFTPETKGEYELEIRVKDKYSDKEYDSHQFLYFNVKEYVEGVIDYVILPSKEYYLVDDEVELEVITQNTQNILIKYVIQIDGHTVEETDFIPNKRFIFKPKRAGKYIVEMYAKNAKCKEGFDSKKDVKVYIHEAPPVTGTKIICDKTNCKINDEITFIVESYGGKEVCYEFYVMEKGNWRVVQRYSRKNYYTFIPFTEGKLRLLALVKSYYKKVAYEDYDTIEIVVEE